MEEVTKTNIAPNLPLSPVVINELVGTKEKTPTPPKKVRLIPWIILGLVISIIIAGLAMLVWSWIQTSKKPDLIIDTSPLLTPETNLLPTPSGETKQLVSQDILFETKPYRNDLAGFEIKVPSGWEVDDSGKSGAIIVFLDPKITMASGSALVNSISVSTGASLRTLAEEVSDAKDGLQKQFTTYMFDEDKEMTISGNTYYLLSGTYTSHNTRMRNRNLIRVYNGRGYAISATAPESVWPKKELLINATIFSFKNI